MRIFLFLAIAILSLQGVSAQYGYGNQNRMNRRMAEPVRTAEPAKEPKTPAEIVEDRIPEYQETFDLDPFEVEVLRTYMEDHVTKMLALQKDRTLKAEDARVSVERLQKEFRTNLSTILNEEEIDELVKMDFSRSAKRKRKKDNN